MASTLPTQKEDRIVFTSGPRGYSVRDVVDAAYFRGELDAPWQELLVRIGAEKKAQESDETLDDAALDSAAIAFRYQYDLITAEETERWLELRGLTLADFSEYFAREYWRRNLTGRLDAPGFAYAAARPEQRELLVIELVLSGELDRMATRLAWRLASSEAAKDSEVEGSLAEGEQAKFQARSGISTAECPESLAGLGRDDAWLDEMVVMEARYRARCERVLTKEARERELSALRLPLTRFDVEMIELESRDAASEAFLCVRDDGMAMVEVAKEGRYPFHRTEMVLEQIATDLQQKFLSLTPGSLLEPSPREDGFLLTRILEKKEPTLEDSDVRDRVDARILERHFSDLTSGRIQWSIIPTRDAAE